MLLGVRGELKKPHESPGGAEVDALVTKDIFATAWYTSKLSLRLRGLGTLLFAVTGIMAEDPPAAYSKKLELRMDFRRHKGGNEVRPCVYQLWRQRNSVCSREA